MDREYGFYNDGNAIRWHVHRLVALYFWWASLRWAAARCIELLQLANCPDNPFFISFLSLFSVTFTSWNNPGRDVMDARARARKQAGACGWRRGEQFGGVQKQNAFVTSWNGLLLPGLYIACSLQITGFSFYGRFQCWQILKSLKFAKNGFPFFLHIVFLICIFLLWSLSKIMIQVTELF